MSSTRPTALKETAMTAKNWLKGLVAGFIATVVLSALMLLKQRMGLVPELNPIEMLTKMAGARGRSFRHGVGHHGARSNARSPPDLWSGAGRHLWTRASRSAAAVSGDASVALDEWTRAGRRVKTARFDVQRKGKAVGI